MSELDSAWIGPVWNAGIEAMVLHSIPPCPPPVSVYICNDLYVVSGILHFIPQIRKYR